ncbi:2-keto-4-pentenoate hydratase/2-oxohepta-3-ene-1,7-dioic acid hydratase in catechol pathway [Rhodovulum bhavnagarense]|uniref:2-keto-4-pentenoate hydratase/2-oxohepta-3-ene-1,7-dioic acid hydratase in catechol pathway n=1 Tax=Rhodovulum bhavnagarense TaxID=992286 RepID=A0A4R2RD32_9RHOB|nr:fumarylacetoacetate hydrolase family protein [Rhodovulum bhavnagarense]TCP60374.1 2-keto-4-pentenoate hydratase/2-oxohepta-3-ene-1,7-dioic acid hydratase in catechol pathway [Rhodovulum bhavnagarense]
MKLMRVGPRGMERPAVMDDHGQIRDISGHVPDFDAFSMVPESLDAVRALKLSSMPVIAPGTRIGPCLAAVPNFYCIGLNYARHAEEAGMAKPTEPIVFSKATTALAGPDDPVILPAGADKADWEVELGVVIGRAAFRVSEAEALSHVAGYCVVNDLSERAYQMDRGGQWIKGKSLPGFGPVGPWMVTADEVADPQDLRLTLALNDVQVQDSTTADMIFTVAQIVSHLSQFMQLVPGDLIATGTPSGVGMGMRPQRFLRPGDVMELGIEGLGRQRQVVLAG